MAENGYTDLEKQKLLLQQHEEKHFTSSEIIRDIIIGVSDGLTVPFALAAGLSGANVTSSIISSPALLKLLPVPSPGAWRFYERGKKNLFCDSYINLCAEAAECGEILAEFELGLEKPDPMRALQSALTIAIYIIGGLIPLSPYMIFPVAKDAVIASILITILALLIFGFIKGHFTGEQPLKSAIQTAFIGAIASAAAYSIAKVFPSLICAIFLSLLFNLYGL
ncbi:hypothetical protein GH714_007400 [Hevea brasiliensis]|uniref:Vacuolar iron transporter n=1 Tax=Hevea brasiliensis TaxID=3981 RepID=A0A6A6LZJ5_HEVBR|nr:hypothetical protein GH714_007400 [Hevea brasiliensis]